MQNGNFQKTKGFTLTELLVVLTIVAIVLSLAIPSFRHTFLQQRSNSAIFDLNNLLNFSRTEAITKGKPITFCASNDQQRCQNLFKDYFIVFEDQNSNLVIDENETLLRVYQIGSWYTLNWAAFGNKPYITYSPLGSINHNNGSLILCPKSRESTYGRIIIINKGGRARFAKDKNGDGIVDKANGLSLNC